MLLILEGIYSKIGSAIAIDLVIDFKDNTRNVQLVSLN